MAWTGVLTFGLCLGSSANWFGSKFVLGKLFFGYTTLSEVAEGWMFAKILRRPSTGGILAFGLCLGSSANWFGSKFVLGKLFFGSTTLSEVAESFYAKVWFKLPFLFSSDTFILTNFELVRLPSARKSFWSASEEQCTELGTSRLL